MKIVFDGRTLLNPHTGIQAHLRELLSQMDSADNDASVSVFMGSKRHVSKSQQADIAAMGLPNVVYKPLINTALDVITHSEDGFLNKQADVFHETGIWKIPTDKPSVITVHDVLPCLFPEMFPADMQRVFVDVVGYNVERASAAIVDSEATKKSFEFFFGRRGLPVHVVYPGISDIYKPEHDNDLERAAREKYNLPEKYLLFLGTIEPRKNVARILEAFASAQKDIPGMALVVAGGYGWDAGHIYFRCEELGIQDKVIFTGYVDELDKPSIYRGATAFLFPSIYEGFGFPPLEAMACGVPVISSDGSSLKEVVGDAGILINPLDSGQLAEAIIKIVNDPVLRNDLVRKGLEQAKMFNWRNTAEKYLEISRSVSD